ncbi:Regulator of nonsense transcripts 1-like [Spatholobus suberectus]|nr:Regulator of nonsense transcripts 1-like [Spatholobus suberectus]
MEGESTSSKKKANYDDYGFMDLIFSWSIEDILNEDLYKNTVKKIELSFQSIDHYLQSYVYPLLEETRAQLCSSMEIMHQAPYAEVIGLKEAKRLQNKLYNLKIDCWKNRFAHHGEPYKTLPGDVLILVDYKPETVKDLLRVGRMWNFVSSVWTTEDEGDSMSFYLKVKASKDVDLKKLRNKTLYVIFLTNVSPNRRIWGALHMPGNLKLLKQILCNRDEGDECCSCGSLGDALRGDYSYQRLLSELNEPQNKAISSCLSGLNCNHNSVVKLIWGPPGTGKTRTLGTLLFALLKMKYRVLVCAPTNVAIKEVASRVGAGP